MRRSFRRIVALLVAATWMAAAAPAWAQELPARLVRVLDAGCSTNRVAELGQLVRELESAEQLTEAESKLLPALRSATTGQTGATRLLLTEAREQGVETSPELLAEVEKVAAEVAEQTPKVQLSPRRFAEWKIEGPFRQYETRELTFYRLRGAKVAWADYPGLRTDYPELAELTDEQIDAWILDNFAYVSEYQLKLQGIRVSEIPIDESQTRRWLIPKGYGRAAVAEARYDGQTVGLMDVKFTGHTNDEAVTEQVEAFHNAPDDASRYAVQVEDHTNGVGTIGEGITEVTRELATRYAAMIESVKTGQRVHTAESRFLIMTPYQVLGNGGGRPGAIYGRRPAWRTGSWGVDDVLGFPFPNVNASTKGTQHGLFDEIMDFGDVKVQWPTVADRFGMYDPSHPWSSVGSRSWVYAHETGDAVANALETGSEDGRAILARHIEDMVGDLRREWESLEAQGYSAPAHDNLDALLAGAGPRGSGNGLGRRSRQAARRYILQSYLVPRLLQQGQLERVAGSLARTRATWVFDQLEVDSKTGSSLLTKYLDAGGEVDEAVARFSKRVDGPMQ